ncbi:hypothetical protein [Nocardioides sp.]|uniref:hypothetical protein n=1 Tax=Nocardioides sp. TaxID=35761 RepID=UPI0035114622
MSALLQPQVRRLDRAERRWLDDARARLRRTHDVHLVAADDDSSSADPLRPTPPTPLGGTR